MIIPDLDEDGGGESDARGKIKSPLYAGMRWRHYFSRSCPRST